VSPYEYVNVNTLSPLGGPIATEAGIYNLDVNGTTTPSFCVDLGHYSSGSQLPYNYTSLDNAPISPTGPMGAAAAKAIKQLWEQYFSPSMIASDAAGLQLAIWNQASIGGGWGSLVINSASIQALTAFGSMNTWLAANSSSAPQANLVALTSQNNQGYVVEIPDGGTTVALLGLTLSGLAAVRRKLGAC
jgi:hypothetical protein